MGNILHTNHVRIHRYLAGTSQFMQLLVMASPDCINVFITI